MTKNCVIMTMEQIEQTFCEIERRIGVHERDVSVLEERTQVFNAWWLAYGSKMADQLVKQIPIVCTVDRQVYEDLTKVEAPTVIEEQSQTDEIWNKTLEWAAQKDREYRQFTEEQEAEERKNK